MLVIVICSSSSKPLPQSFRVRSNFLIAALLPITREREHDSAGPSAPSRGDLVVRWLESSQAPEEFLATLDLSGFNGVNLVVGRVAQTGLAVFCTSNRGIAHLSDNRFEVIGDEDSRRPRGSTYVFQVHKHKKRLAHPVALNMSSGTFAGSATKKALLQTMQWAILQFQ